MVEFDGKLIIGGGLLPFTHEASEEVVRVFKTARARARRELGKLKAEDAAVSDIAHSCQSDFLLRCWTTGPT